MAKFKDGDFPPPPSGGGDDNDQGTGTKGLDSIRLAQDMITRIKKVDINKYINSDGILTENKAKEMSKAGHQAICDAINNEVLNNCYVNISYTGVLTAFSPPPPDLNGVYKFRVQQCNIKAENVYFYAKNYLNAMQYYENVLSYALTQSIKFKVGDDSSTPSYVTLSTPILNILEGSLKIKIPRNNNNSPIDQKTMMDNLASAVVSAIKNASVDPASGDATTRGPGKGAYVFTVGGIK